MPEFERQINYVKGKKITDMKEGEIIYIQKSISGFGVSIECEFIKFERGKVFAKPFRCDYDWMKLEDLYPDGVVTARPNKCYLWGLRKLRQRMSDHDYCCHFFEGGVVDE
jgi:hypothetical protein